MLSVSRNCLVWVIISPLILYYSNKSLLLAQDRLIIDGAYIQLQGGARLVIGNSSPNAITRLSGHIISEDSIDIVRWYIGTSNNKYTIPFGYSNTDYLPVTVRTNNAVGTNGFIDFATYGIPNYLNSSYLPPGITNFSGYSASDNSPYTVDRFWLIRVSNYLQNPDFDTLSLTYRNSEYTNTGNTITESNLIIQRYNYTLGVWDDYIPGNGNVVVDSISNRVTTFDIPYYQLFDWWVLVDRTSPLPVELLIFSAVPEKNNTVSIFWKTASEVNSDYFMVQRSDDAIHWEDIIYQKAAGNSNTPLLYTCVDENPLSGLSYYRLKMVDIDQSFEYSNIVSVILNSSETSNIKVYPNPAGEYLILSGLEKKEQLYKLKIIDMNGRIVNNDIIYGNETNNGLEINISHLTEGAYYLVTEKDGQIIGGVKFIKK